MGQKGLYRIGEEGHGIAQKSIGSHLEEDGGQDDTATSRGFDVGIREPCMKREKGNLDGKGQGKGQEKQLLHLEGEGQSIEFLDIKGLPSRIIEIQNCGQHKKTSYHREKDKLDGGIQSPGTSPETDDKIHGDQHDFPKNVEKENIQGHKDTEDTHFQKEEKDKIFLKTLLDTCPRRQKNNGG